MWLREKLKAGAKLGDFAVQKQRLLAKFPRKNKEAPRQKVTRFYLSGQLFRSRREERRYPGGVRGELPRTWVTLAGSLPLLFFDAMWSAMERWGYQSPKRGGGDPVFSGADGPTGWTYQNIPTA